MAVNISGDTGIDKITDGTIVGADIASTFDLTGKTVTLPSGANVISAGTAVASTSGTSIDFTSIPSWVKRITVMFNAVSTNGTSLLQIQIGDSGGVETSGYNSGAATQASATLYTANVTTGFVLSVSNDGASSSRHGSYILSKLDGDNWVGQGNIHESASYTIGYHCAGSKTLSATLDRVRITTVNGTDTFDAGSINILYE